MKKQLLRLFLFGISFATSRVSAQIAQDHPELCGRPGASIGIPPGVRWVPPSNGANLDSTLFISDGVGERQIDLQVWPSIEQICQIPQNQLILFGQPGDGNYSITRIDRSSGRILDAIGGRSPSMSPNQQWLMMRAYRHFRSELSNSEEYLLYDLTEDGKSNRRPGLTPFTQDLVGRPVYPIPDDGVPFEFENQPAEMTHTFRSDAFHWAPDSSAVVFADSVMNKLSVIVVKMRPEGPSTLVLPVHISGLCEPQTGDNADHPVPTLTAVDFAAPNALVVNFDASRFCKAAQMTLHLEDFRPPKPEVHRPPKRRGGTLKDVPFKP